MDKFAILKAISGLYLVITGFVIGRVLDLKIHWFFKSIIILVAIYWPPAGLVWYLILLYLDKRKKKKDKDKKKDENEKKDE
jgi:hypothetical protein